MALSNYTIGQQYASLASPTVANQPPLTLSNMGVSTGLQLDVINKKLQIESTLDEIFYDLGANVVSVGKRVPIPNAIYMRLQAQPTGARSVTVPILQPTKGLPRGGNAEQQKGYERPMYMKYGKFYYNEYSQALAGAEWGIDFNDVAQFNLFAEIQPQLSKYFKEVYGMWIREALLQTYCTVLTKAPVSLTQEWNDNWFVANTDFGAQPAYDATGADFTANIVAALTAAATGTNGVNANIDLSYLLAAEHYAANQKRIQPIMIGGQRRYVVLLPSSQIQLLTSTDTGQLGGVWKDVSALSTEEQNFPGVVGRVKSLLIVDDQRYPTITESGGAISVTYCAPGNEDSRNTTVYSGSNKSWDIGVLLGAPAVCDWEPKGLHFETDREEYGKVYGKGAFGERGIQLVKYDVDSESDTSRMNYGSVVLAMTAPSIVVTA